MASRIRRQDYILAMMMANWRAHLFGIRRTAVMSGVMLIQNFMFFVLWIIFFRSVGQVKGWGLDDVAILYGTIALSVGMCLCLCGGARNIAMYVAEGTLDSYIARPRHPLPAILMSRTDTASFGDMASAPFYWFVFGGLNLVQLPEVILLSLMSSVIFLSVIVMFYSLSFWVSRSGRFSDQLFEMLIIFASVPQNGQTLGVQLAMFSVLPAGFITLMPVDIIRHFDAEKMAIMAVAMVLYAATAILVFNAGLRRYRRAMS